MNRTMPGFPVHHQLPEFTHTHVHQVGDASQPSHPVIPFSSRLQSSPASGSFQMSQFFASGGQSTGVSASASVLPMNAVLCCAKLLQSCPTLCDPMDCSPSGSSVHRILQARILEWVAISFSRGSSRPRDRTQVSYIAGRRFNL